MNGHDLQTGRIVVGYDGSPQAEAALGWATDEACRRQVPLTVVHVADLMEYVPITPGPAPLLTLDVAEENARQVTEQGVAAARARLRSGGRPHQPVDIASVTRIARVANALIEMSDGALLLVVGTRGHGDLAGAILGSVAFAVSAYARCPVVVVRGDRMRVPAPMHPVVVGVDGSECSIAAARFAADVAEPAAATLHVVTGYRMLPPVEESAGDPDVETIARQSATQAAQAAVRAVRAEHPNLAVEHHVVEGTPASVLASGSAGAGLVVVGSRGRGGFAGLMLGSVSHALIHVAGCPVAVVHGATRPAAPGPVAAHSGRSGHAGRDANLEPAAADYSDYSV